MRTLNEILKRPHLIVEQSGPDGGRGRLYIDWKKPNKSAVVVWSNGGGWDHVSVSWPNRCPSWEEMCRVKDIFFLPEETCIEYHPAASEYVNQHPYCLHIWKPQNEVIPKPPTWMVGLKDGQSLSEAMREAEERCHEIEPCGGAQK